MRRFKFTKYEDGQKLSGTFVKYGNMLKKHKNKNISKRSLENVTNKSRNALETLQETLSQRFESQT